MAPKKTRGLVIDGGCGCIVCYASALVDLAIEMKGENGAKLLCLALAGIINSDNLSLDDAIRFVTYNVGPGKIGSPEAPHTPANLH